MTYVAQAVHFTTGTRLVNSSLSCTDNGKFSISFWYKNPTATGGALANLVYRGDPTGAGVNYVSLGPPTAFNAQFETGDNTATLFQALDYDVPTASIWHHILFSSDTSTAAGRYQLYIDGILVTPDVQEDDSPFTPTFNGVPLYVGDDSTGNHLIADLCDVWIAPGVSLLNGSFVIPQATIDLFRTKPGIAGQPQDPSGFPAGGAVLLSGDSTGFQTNQGSGGSFTLGGVLTDAADSPSTQVLIPELKCMVFSGAGDETVTLPSDFDHFSLMHSIGAGQAGEFAQGGLGGDGGSYANITTGLSHFSTLGPGDSFDIHTAPITNGDHAAGDDSWVKDGSGTIRLLAPGGASSTPAVGDLVNAGGSALTQVRSNYVGGTVLVTDVPYTVRPPNFAVGPPNSFGSNITNIGGGGGGGAGGPDGPGADSGDITPLYYYVDVFGSSESLFRAGTSALAGAMGAAGGAANGGQPGGGTYTLAHGLLHWDGFPVIPGEGGDATTTDIQGGRPFPTAGLPAAGTSGPDGAGGGSGPDDMGVTNFGGNGGDGLRWVDSVNSLLMIGPGGGGGGACGWSGQNPTTVASGGKGGNCGGGGGGSQGGVFGDPDGGAGGIAIYYMTPALNLPSWGSSRTRIWGTWPMSV